MQQGASPPSPLATLQHSSSWSVYDSIWRRVQHHTAAWPALATPQAGQGPRRAVATAARQQRRRWKPQLPHAAATADTATLTRRASASAQPAPARGHVSHRFKTNSIKIHHSWECTCGSGLQSILAPSRCIPVEKGSSLWTGGGWRSHPHTRATLRAGAVHLQACAAAAPLPNGAACQCRARRPFSTRAALTQRRCVRCRVGTPESGSSWVAGLACGRCLPASFTAIVC